MEDVEMKKKTLLSVILAAAMCTSLSACGGSENSDSSGNNSSNQLSVSIWDNNQLPGLRQLMDDFTNETGIAVEIQVVPWDQYWTLLEAGAQGNTLPDVFWMHSTYSQRFMRGGVLLDLTPYRSK